MQERFNELRVKHPVFTYEGYEINDLVDRVEINYHFSVGDFASFSPKWTLMKSQIGFFDRNDHIIDDLVFNLGMVELISYWKITCSPKVIIKAGTVDEVQVNWWKKQYFLGLGEFFHTNGIHTGFESFMELEAVESSGSTNPERQEQVCQAEQGCLNRQGNADQGDQAGKKESSRADCGRSLQGYLIPIGGGKDSAVSLELLAGHSDSNLCYIINPREASLQTAKTAGYPDEKIICVNRTLDPKMLALNREGYLNGHTPFSAIVAFSSVLLAYLNKKKYVALSNESSANESTVEGTLINHQYSKSFQFECDFNEYERKYINSGVHYFSILRPFSELQIAQNFAQHKKYFKAFKSCNAGSKADKWCCSCPKCLFVYLILSPFIAQEIVQDIFGEDLLEKEKLIVTLEELIGVRPEKPFECVGTRDEINTAICLAIGKNGWGGKPGPRLVEHYKTLDVYREYKDKENRYNEYFDENHLIPKDIIDHVKKMML